MKKNLKEEQKCRDNFDPEQFRESIKAKAAELYEQSGRKPGRDVDNWLKAERIVKEKHCSGKHKTLW